MEDYYMTEKALSKQELWKSRVLDYQTSGLSSHDWCSQNHFHISTLHYWTSKLDRNNCICDTDSNLVFAELPITTTFPLCGATPVTIHMGAIRIEVADTCHPDLLSHLVSILKNYA